MKGSGSSQTDATAFPAGDAQMQPPATVRNGRGVPQHCPRLRLKKQVDVLRIGSWNVGTMTGRGREIVDVMMRRKVGILCVQETKWKGNCSRQLGSGYKLIYTGENAKENGVGVVLSAELGEKVVKVERHSDRIINVQVVIEKRVWNIISTYAPQTGRQQEEKDVFLEKLEGAIRKIPTNEMIVVGGDFNAHVGERSPEYLEEHGQHGFGVRNKEGERLLESLQALELFAANTGFKKKQEQLITYKSAGHDTQVDYILVRKEDKKRIKDAKVLPFEAVTRQHRLLVTDIVVVKDRRKQQCKKPQKTKIWKLGDEAKEYNRLVREKMSKTKEGDQLDEIWKDMSRILGEAAAETCGRTRGGRLRENETWWWDKEVQEKLKEKKRAYKTLRDGTGSIDEYKRLKKEAKKAVARAKEKAWKKWYDKLETKEGEDQIYRIAKNRAKQKKDITQVAVIKDKEGNILIEEMKIKRRWHEYFKELLNEENERDELEKVEVVSGPVEEFSEEEVKNAVREMKTGKASGPSGISAEYFKYLDSDGLKCLTDLLNKIFETERIPKGWTRSYLVTIFKDKGDPMQCKNFRGIKLLEHGLKVLEKVLDNRLRKLIRICDNQFGFSKGKGTTDAVFVLRQLQEKMLEKQKKMHVAFLDLEKAYDRVPRDVVYWCLRKRGVPEKMVNLVKATYDQVKTKVRTPYGDTEGFMIDVGLHQGSALSPFLFIILMDTLTEEVRTKTLWELIFADDIALVACTEEELQEKVQKWQRNLSRGGLKMSVEKSEVLVSERGGKSEVKIKENKGKELRQVEHFKYLGSEIEAEGGVLGAVKQRVKAAWAKWREVTGVICDRKIPRKLKCRIYKTVVRPVLLYGGECWAVRKKEEELLRRTEMRMLRWILGVSLKDRLMNEEIRKRCAVTDVVEKLREARLRWFGHVMRRDNEEAVRMALETEIKGSRARGRPRRRWKDCITSDLEMKRLVEEDARDRRKWRTVIRAADPRTVWD